MPPRLKRLAMRLAARVLASPERYRWAGRLLRWSLRRLPRRVLYGPWNGWGRARELPPAPAESFLEWYRKTRASATAQQ
nr:lactate utilisation protein LutB domain-containing protein [Rhodothermus marinus]